MKISGFRIVSAHSVASSCAALLLASFLVAGCATNSRATADNGLKSANEAAWTGRISLQVHESPSAAAQFFSAGFELSGQPEIGTLTLTSPLGNVLGVLRWQPGEAVLDSGDGKLQRFPSVEALLAQTTGAAIPLSALFGWLQGDNPPVAGWTADLSRFNEGRIAARRSQPSPQADLRVVVDGPR